jgi:hypothetical protein
MSKSRSTIKSLKVSLAILSSLVISGCGDFPTYAYDQSEDYCMMSFPFAGGTLGRQYVGYMRIISTLQYLDDDPSYRVIATGPSHIELEAGSFQKLIIGDKIFKPKFVKSHLEAELQLRGPTFIFDEQQSTEIYRLMQDGYNFEVKGRLEVGRQYETPVYNFFFDSSDAPFRDCINRLLDPEDLIELEKKKLNSPVSENESSEDTDQ